MTEVFVTDGYIIFITIEKSQTFILNSNIPEKKLYQRD